MRILLLGGSNAGVKDGWAVQFAQIAAGHEVENRFLGAVGSLYGLMALMKRARDNAPAPDLIVFEYCLNDILLREAGVLRPALVTDALEAVADDCAREGVPLLFLNLEPRPAGKLRRKAVRRVGKRYAAVARHRGVSCLWLRDVFPKALSMLHYQDENHLTTDASGHVAQALLAMVEAGAPAPALRDGQAPRFDYVDARQTRARGPCALRDLTSRVFDGTFLEIERGGASFWRGHGALVALMLQSNDKSGVYSIRARGEEVRKTARSQMQEIVRNLMLLHYTAGGLRSDGEVEIAMPADEEALMRLPANRGLLEASATEPFETQTLRIHGVIFWRDASLRARLRNFVKRWL